MYNSLAVSTGFVPSTRWDGRKLCGVTLAVGIGGLLSRYVAPAMAAVSTSRAMTLAEVDLEEEEITAASRTPAI